MSAIAANPLQHPAGIYNTHTEHRPKIDRNASSTINKGVSTSAGGRKLTEDVHAMDPDDMFARHTVYEMKSILYRLKCVFPRINTGLSSTSTSGQT